MKKHVFGGATCILAIVISFASTPLAQAQTDPQSRSENQPVAPFHIVGNIYYVGASDVTSFLIVTAAGDILLDGGFVQTAPQIEANIGKLGFKLSDVKILLNSHAHFDHCGGLAELKQRTGLRFRRSSLTALYAMATRSHSVASPSPRISPPAIREAAPPGR